MSKHKHQCGLVTVDEAGATMLLEGFGCKYVWEHDDTQAGSVFEKIARHTCPQCGLGPWYGAYKASKAAAGLMATLTLLMLQGCAVVPAPDMCFASYDHVSHPRLGPPFGPETEEGTIDSIGTSCRWERGRVFFESGLSYMVPDSDLYGDDFLYNGRIGVKIWER